ncbi:hypothetical protein BKP56_06855 [Marinilactibacillus sp. 15R]|uniref:hypothetical protein n=1 Tax=Marinilactibacillus sp. 15R TaxID=1911586 RepID=UPI00090B6829|nr:hypothetical protein [Marinilactibacillus sp. 15R]API88990.1 hypothetical protein BKP56_06855 [Marinilactibacillus sp. 15R]
MTKRKVTFLLLLAYSVPFAFLAMNGDLRSHTMMYYGFMTVSLILLSLITAKKSNVRIIVFGNILSFLSSYIFILLTDILQDQWYFAPFSAVGLLIFLTILSLLLQFIIALLARNFMNV